MTQHDYSDQEAVDVYSVEEGGLKVWVRSVCAESIHGPHFTAEMWIDNLEEERAVVESGLVDPATFRRLVAVAAQAFALSCGIRHQKNA